MDSKLKTLIDQINSKDPTFEGSIRAVEQTDAQRADGESPQFELSFSSEDPYERWFGIEVLGHKKTEVRMDWIGSGNAPLLLQHNHDQLIGVIDTAKLSGSRGTAAVRFGKGALAQEIKQDVEDGIRQNVSVGYRVHEMKLVKGKDNAPDEYRVTDWEPFEVSIVSVPADRSVGTNRQAEPAPSPSKPKEKEKLMDPKELSSEAVRLGLSPEASLKAVMAEQAKQAAAEGQKAADSAHKSELDRQSGIRELGKAHNASTEAEAAIVAEKSVDTFRAEVLATYSAGLLLVAPSAPQTSPSEARDLARYSFVKAIREKADGTLSGIEAEMHADGVKEAKESGVAVSGLSIPHSVLQRDLTVGTEGTDVVATGITGFIDLLRNKMIVQQLGAQFLTGLTGNIQIPKLTAGAAAAWEGENDAGAEGTQTLGQLALSPKRVGCYTDISKQLIIQSSIDIERMVQNDLATAIALAIDFAAIAGPGSGDAPTGILSTSGIGSVVGGTNGLAPTLAHIIALESAVAVDNADIGNLSYLTNTSVRGKLKSTPRVASTDSLMVWADGMQPLNGYGCAVSNQVPANLTKGNSTAVASAIVFGNFNDLIVAQWGGLDIVVDPLTLATTNMLRIVANTYADVGVRNAASFAAMADALTA